MPESLGEPGKFCLAMPGVINRDAKLGHPQSFFRQFFRWETHIELNGGLAADFPCLITKGASQSGFFT